MMPLPHQKRTTAAGGIGLTLLVGTFIVALIAALSVAFLLWRDAGYSFTALSHVLRYRTLPATTPSPNLTADLLAPTFTVDPALGSDYAELERQLFAPMRQYYATKAERLSAVVVTPAPAGESETAHTTRVVYTVYTATGAEERTFYYDRTGEGGAGSFPRWEPSLLDVTE